jgi:hypothetical protein
MTFRVQLKDVEVDACNGASSGQPYHYYFLHVFDMKVVTLIPNN